MNELSRLSPPKGAVRRKRRLGRGIGSGKGKTCGKGQKGQKTRSGAKIHPSFEGGQMPLQRRLPKYGFHNPFRKTYSIVNLRDLERVGGDAVNAESLASVGLVKNANAEVKILGDGDVGKAFNIKVHKISAAARSKIEAAGGTVEVIGG